jgi:hypothetical protein
MSKTTKTTRKRARNNKGQYKGDNPSTPDMNEAWEMTEPKYIYMADKITSRLSAHIAKMQQRISEG